MSENHPPLGNIKGAAFRQFIAWWEETQGPASLVTALEAARAQNLGKSLTTEREALGILPSTWYPAELVHALLDSLLKDVDHRTRQAMANEGADVVMKSTLSGVYKAVFSMLASPRLFATYIQRMWNMHYDSGIVTIEQEPMLHRTRYIDWHSHHPFICQLNMASARPLYMAMGCTSVDVQPVGCVSQGADQCQFIVRWEK